MVEEVGGGRETERSCNNLVGTPISTAASVQRTDSLLPLTSTHYNYKQSIYIHTGKVFKNKFVLKLNVPKIIFAQLICLVISFFIKRK